MRIDLHELEKVHSAPNAQQGATTASNHLLRVAVITNQCVNCGSTFADRPTAQNHVVNSWSRGTCRTDRSHTTWSLEEVTHSQSVATFASKNLGICKRITRHARLTHLPFPAPTIRGSRHAQPLRQPRRNEATRKKWTRAASPGSIKRDGSLVAQEQQSRRQLRQTASRTEAKRRGQRLDDNGGQAQSRQQGRAEDPQQNHVQGHPQDASDDTRRTPRRCGTLC